jgi:hypothetical protein
MLRAVPSAHAADVQTRPLVCTGCHEQQRHAETRSDVDCVECHMPVSPTRVAAARTHRVLGGWSALGAGGADLEQRELALDWMRGRQLAIDVYPPRDPAAARTRGYVDNAVFAASEATPYVTLGEELALKIVVTNTRIGHGFPGRLGPRQSWLAVRVVDGQNQLVFEAGAPDDAGVEPSDTRVYRNPSDARDAIAPGRSEVNAFAFRVPYWVKGDLTVVARVRYGVARAEAGAATPAVIDLAEATRTFPVRQRPEQEVASRVPR